MNTPDQQNDPSRVLYRYTTAIDTKDWALLRQCFTSTCRFTATELLLDGVDEIVEFMERVHEHIDGSQHRLTNTRIDIDPDGRSARASTYLDAFIVHSGHRDGPTFQLLAEYHDRLQYDPAADADGGRWLIAERHVTSLWSLGNASILGPAD